MVFSNVVQMCKNLQYFKNIQAQKWLLRLTVIIDLFLIKKHKIPSFDL